MYTGSECGLGVEGVQTMMWEILEQARSQHSHTTGSFSDLFIQVGGGALGAGLSQGLRRAHNGELTEIVPGLTVPEVRIHLSVGIYGRMYVLARVGIPSNLPAYACTRARTLNTPIFVSMNSHVWSVPNS